MSDLASDLTHEILRNQTDLLGDQTPAVRREVVLKMHDYFTREDSTGFVYGPVLLPVEGMSTPWSPDDLGWSLRRLLDYLPTISDAPWWVPALIAAALGPDGLGEHEESVSTAFDALHHQWISPLAMTDLARLFGTALSGRHGGVPADLVVSASPAGELPAELGKLLAGAEVQAVFRFAATLSKPAPAKAWLRAADDLLAASPPARQAVTLFLEPYRAVRGPVHDYTDELLRGLVWMQSRTPGAESTALLCDVATAIGVPWQRGGSAVVALKASTAVVDILAERPGDAPVRALARLSLSVRGKSFLARIRATLERLGAERGWEPGEAHELTVDDHGLGADGRLVQPLPGDDGRAGIVEFTGGKARLRAFRAGVALRAVPPEWKDELAEARAAVTAINRTAGLERLRLEGLLSQQRVWAWPVWSQRYLDHPIIGDFARRLIWQVSPDGSTWTSGFPERWSLSDQPGADWRVRLWHPALAGADEVAHWRDVVAETAVRQPFKQAYREVYPLTPAEVETGAYSNRFAAHILRYRQANALMRERGWAANYLGTWSSGHHGEATREFGAGQWQASFFHDRVETEGDLYDTTYCATDQVRFARRDGRAWAGTPLAEVPPLVFSEAMRDVDLFVGVTSIAADDTWHDRGEDRFRQYWDRVVFGDLTPRGELRRDVLTRLLPRLAIGPRCEVRGHFLRVEGTLGAYRIHLGSGNILMEPDDAYLCIVPDRRPSAKVLLPFEDDTLLSAILSKAIMLAADDKITDPTIRVQLGRGRW